MSVAGAAAINPDSVRAKGGAAQTRRNRRGDAALSCAQSCPPQPGWLIMSGGATPTERIRHWPVLASSPSRSRRGPPDVSSCRTAGRDTDGAACSSQSSAVLP